MTAAGLEAPTLRGQCKQLAGDHIRLWRAIVHAGGPTAITDPERTYHLAAYTALAMVGTRPAPPAPGERRRYRGRR